ncbi:bifunctional glycosyltransferase family 2/GtrA family protein [Terriglobus sp. TAA 43]|uniref:bifunctional glycosyltransferase family 2/GtrA family protein n=1 Tax=Terriglobus sp. TAA 43 TaxID=278961 RepID=UPI000648B6D0|nr:bifunctional glycosyltransferase family 2/GtrA family protein [Terriglobus sp. TAA 43]
MVEATRPSVVVLIPAWHPDERLLQLVTELQAHLRLRIVIVLDGDQEQYPQIVESLSNLESVTLLKHVVNLGKGRALKTGFNWILAELPTAIGVVTADADGQHTPEDIVRVAEALIVEPKRFILGARSFHGDVPFRSRMGNSITRNLFWMLAGRRIQDTQTGLRGIPLHRLAGLMTLNGERYEYEMNMLAYLCRSGAPPVEVPIRTIYIENNRSSHFDPIRDSMRIYFVLLRFYFSSLIAAGIDFIFFTVTFSLTHDVLYSMVVGRLSSIANFLLNRRFVFHSSTSVRGALWRYYALVVVFGAIGYGVITGLSRWLHVPVLLAKIVTETVLSLASFALQRLFVFPASSVPE